MAGATDRARDDGFSEFSRNSKICNCRRRNRPCADAGEISEKYFKKFMSGLLSLYNVTSYLSDVLSYSRLLALGLATGVIATVINTMARMLGVNIFGYIAMLLVLIGGHLFNVAVNALGAYVHSSRLQYIEFFGKFYEGGGKPFQPLRIDTKYVDLEDIGRVNLKNQTFEGGV